MDSEGRELWDLKLAQLRKARRRDYDNRLAKLAGRGLDGAGGAAVTSYFEGANISLGEIYQEWERIERDSWSRDHFSPAENIGELLHGEVTKAAEEITTQLTRAAGSPPVEALMQGGVETLKESAGILAKRAKGVIVGLQKARDAAVQAEKSEKKWKIAGLTLPLLTGALISSFSVWLTNRANQANLEPHVRLSINSPNEFGVIPIKDDKLNLSIENIGPTDLEDLAIDFGTFHASLDMKTILPDAMRTKPNFHVDSLNKGTTKVIHFGTDDGSPDRYVWANVFKNEEKVYSKDPKTKGLLLFCRVQVRYRRARDKKLFFTTRLFHANRAALIPWNAPTREDYFAGLDN